MSLNSRVQFRRDRKGDYSFAQTRSPRSPRSFYILYKIIKESIYIYIHFLSARQRVRVTIETLFFFRAIKSILTLLRGV